MIRLKDKVLENYFIDPVTAVITDKDGDVQETTIHQGYLMFKKMGVHRIQAYTHLGYIAEYVVHHIDGNKMNNALSNLVYMTPHDHSKLHSANISTDIKQKISASLKGRISQTKGMHQSIETRQRISEALKGKSKPPRSDEHKKHLSEARKNYHPSEEAKRKMSEVMKGRHLSEETKRKIGEAHKGMHWWTNGVETKKCKECPGEGWVRGIAL